VWALWGGVIRADCVGYIEEWLRVLQIDREKMALSMLLWSTAWWMARKLVVKTCMHRTSRLERWARGSAARRTDGDKFCTDCTEATLFSGAEEGEGAKR
jgi:hypothetical protein